jgi:hypothetical protein
VRIGVSYSHRHARHLRLDPIASFEQVAAMGFGPLRISTYWDEVASEGYTTLDALVSAAERAQAGLILTIGVKAMRWPEFYAPSAIGSSEMEERLLEFVGDTVRRYRGSRAVEAWQVENEPRNRSGPTRRLVPIRILSEEMALIRRLDPRPRIISAFFHFAELLDLLSQPWPWRHASADILPLLGSGDILGVDVYPIAPVTLGIFRWQSRASADWPAKLGQLREAAHSAGVEAWVVEAQAEPWQPARFEPDDVLRLVDGITEAGFTTLLLWGCEYWLKRHNEGDSRWLNRAEKILRDAASAR